MKKIILSIMVLVSVLVTSFAMGFELQPTFTTMKNPQGQGEVLVYSITPVIDIDFLKIGVGINAFQDKIGGMFYYGTPTKDATYTTNFLNGLSLNLVEVNVGPLGARYGYMIPQTFGLGTLLYRYSVPNTRAFDFRVGDKDGINVQAHLPIAIASWTPFALAESANLYYGTANLNIGPAKVSLLGATNNIGQYLGKEKKTGHSDLIAGTAAYFDFLLRFGVEGGYVTTKDLTPNSTKTTTGYGVAAGALLDLGIVSLKVLPVAYLNEQYIIGYLDSGYETLKTVNGADVNYTNLIQSKGSRLGGLVEVQSAMGNLYSAYARYTYDMDFKFTNISNQKLLASLSVRSPFKEYPFIVSGSYNRYFDTWNFSDANGYKNSILGLIGNLFDDKTDVVFIVAYPVVQGMNVSYITYYDHTKNGWGQKIEFGGSMTF